MLREWKCDLHIHTSLSPCADKEMSPRAIVRTAKKRGLNIIGISDHNSTENVGAMKEAGRRENLAVLGGMEITSNEEVHILAFFDRDGDLETLQGIVYDNLEGVNDEKALGQQIMFDEEGNTIGRNKRLLMGATGLLLQTIVETIHSLGGLVIASHVDREVFSIISQLGFIPSDMALDGLELSPFGSREEFKTKWPEAFERYPLATFSDAHYLKDIGRTVTGLLLEEATVEETRKALRGEDGRSISSYT